MLVIRLFKNFAQALKSFETCQFIFSPSSSLLRTIVSLTFGTFFLFSWRFHRTNLKHPPREEICATVSFFFLAAMLLTIFHDDNHQQKLSYIVFTTFQLGLTLLMYLTEFVFFTSKDPDKLLCENCKCIQFSFKTWNFFSHETPRAAWKPYLFNNDHIWIGIYKFFSEHLWTLLMCTNIFCF